jgi:hypothetical protein
MQRRAAGHPSASPANPPIPTSIGGSRGGHFPIRTKKKKLNPVLMLILAAVLLLFVSVYFFPTEVEQEAEYVGHELANRARQAEHKVEELLLHHQAEGGGGGAAPAQGNDDGLDASARMLAQSSKWVDGEKALKKKLRVLSDLQQKGEYLGAQVLTRYLGDDFPAWVSKDVNEEEWRTNVKTKYAEMREEEEEWKIRMQQMIDQRERDIGITTAR